MPRKSSATDEKRSTWNVCQVVGSNIKARRVALGWSQQELADQFGVSRTAVSQYEIGTGEVNAGDLPRLAEILGISLLEFYEGPLLDLRATSTQEKNWAIETAAALFAKHGRIVATRQDVFTEERMSTIGRENQSSRDDIFVLDDWLGAAFVIPKAGKMQRDIKTVVRLAEFAGRFLSLSGRDQETLSRVAEALQAKPAADPLS